LTHFILKPCLMPSFLARGVCEYPAIVKKYLPAMKMKTDEDKNLRFAHLFAPLNIKLKEALFGAELPDN